MVEADGDRIEDVADGAGDAVLRMLLKPALWPGARGLGCANCVEDVVVDVVGGGGERAANGLTDGWAAEGVADWKSSKSSSSSMTGAATAGAFPMVEVVTGSSPKSNRSGSGALGLGASRLALVAAVLLLVVAVVRLGRVVGCTSSPSSYSSNCSPRR